MVLVTPGVRRPGEARARRESIPGLCIYVCEAMYRKQGAEGAVFRMWPSALAWSPQTEWAWPLSAFVGSSWAFTTVQLLISKPGRKYLSYVYRDFTQNE